MKTHVALAWAAVVFAAVAGAQPTINPGGVVNAASYANPAMPNGSIAQGSMFIVFGRNLGPANLVQTLALPYTANAGGTSIKVTVGATTVDALMIYSVASQVAAILPSNTPTGAGKVTVSYNNATSTAADIRVVPASLGIFTRNQAGSGPAIVQNYVSQTETPTNAVFDAAHPGQYMILWGTGLGPITGSDATTPPIGDLATSVEVLIGSKRAQVQYKGRSGYPGIDQINFIIPQDVQLGCYVPLAVRAGGVTSNYTSLAIAASGSTCSESVTGYSAADLERAIAKGNVSIGSIALSRSRIGLGISVPIPGFPSEIKTDTGGGSFFRYNTTNLAASRSAFGSVTPYGACSVFTFSGSTPDAVDPVAAEGLEAGAALTVTGPKGVKQLNRESKGLYGGQLGGGLSAGGAGQPDYLEPGPYTVTGTGGADVGSFTANLTVPQLLTWLNKADISAVNRANNLPITWQGGGANQFVSIIGYSLVGEAGAGFVCTELASRGTFTVDSAVLSALPQSPASEEIPSGFLGLITGSAGEGGKFTATGLDFGYITYTDTDLKNVTYR